MIIQSFASGAKKVFSLYYDGFRTMTVGRKLWLIIAIKLVIMFGVFKFFFFENKLQNEFSTDEERSNYVIEQLTTTRN